MVRQSFRKFNGKLYELYDSENQSTEVLDIVDDLKARHISYRIIKNPKGNDTYLIYTEFKKV